jgi:C4-dicarboxylate transporter DctM subunit
MIVVICFFALLLLGVPISILILISSTVGIAVYSHVSFVVLAQQMFNSLGNYVLLAIPLFIMSGNIAARGDIAKRLVNVMRMIFGRIQGGTAIAGIAACAFFAAISGSSMATIVAIGGILMPALIEMGYPRNMAEGSITAAGSIGILIPPSCSMVMICVAMNTSVGRQFMAGFIPGILLAVVWSLYIFFICKKSRIVDSKIYTKEEKKKVWKESIFALLYPVIVLGSIYSGLATPTEAAAIAFVYVVIIELFVFRTLSMKQIVAECSTALVSSGSILIIIGCAGVLNWLVTTQQIPAAISSWIALNISSKAAFILIVGLIFLISGCFMDLIALILILGPILQPTLTVYGVDGIHFGIIAVLYTQIAYLTPPFGLNLYVTMGLQKRSLTEVARATLPYLLILIVYTVVVSFVPEISLFLPNLLMGK